VRGFFNYLLRERVVAATRRVDVRAPKAAKRLPGTLDVDQISQLLDIPPTTRSPCATAPSWSSSIRRAALAELVSLDSPTRSRRPHRARARQGPQDAHRARGPQGERAIRVWLKERAALAALDETALFVGKNGDR
jgi:integrase/recombinase XerC